MPHSRKLFHMPLFSALACLLFAVPAAPAEFPPQELTNLQVLPADTDVRELIGVMRGFATGLGVRCEHCHVGEPGQPLSTFDFASDKKASKQKARVMLEMTRAINETHLPKLGLAADERLRVECRTCHHGRVRPESLQGLLRRTVESDGVEGASRRYAELREKHYGRDAYDFGEQTLLGLAEGLFRDGKADGAEAMLRLNLESFPESVGSFAFLAELYRLTERFDKAREALDKGLELDPQDRRLGAIRQKLEEGAGTRD